MYGAERDGFAEKIAIRIRLRIHDWQHSCEARRPFVISPSLCGRQKLLRAAQLIDSHSGERAALEAATIRGVLSEGMACSKRELGLGDDHTGILVLPDDAPVGTPLASYLPDDALELEVTANRGDCLSVLGVAHETAAVTGGSVSEPPFDYPEEGPGIDGVVTVRIANPELCSRYMASVVRGISVGPSPPWLQERLSQAGLRPINNVVDVTNYVMLEYGQPLHAFDLSTVRQGSIVVRAARAKERFQTLDGLLTFLARMLQTYRPASPEEDVAG